jgi:acetyl-CoA acyltransferase
MAQAYIVDGTRTPIGNFKGTLSGIRTDDLAAIPIRALLEKYPDLPPEAIDDVILGCANQAGEDNRNLARMALLLAGMPYTVPGETVNRLCASGMSAAIHAYRAVALGDADLIISGGAEHMTRAPWVISKASTPFGNDAEMFDSSFGWRFINPKMKALYGTDAMGETAENLAELFKISRADQDAFAFNSQRKASEARNTGRLSKEITIIPIPRKKEEPLIFQHDEFIKDQTSIDGLSKLKPAFKSNGTVTAGNASGLNDGASALLISSRHALQKYHLTPIARIVSSAVSGVEPRVMGIGPVDASAKALKKAKLKLSDMDIIEINEAFAVQVISCMRQMGLTEHDSRLNPNGGALALGHPLGMSGSRILLSAALELRERNMRYALVTMCVGVGQGYATIIENAEFTKWH